MSLANDIQEVGRVIDTLEEFGAAQGISPGEALRFGLVLDELITNIVSYGLVGRPELRLHGLKGLLHGGQLVARLRRGRRW